MTITILPNWTPGTSQALYGNLEVGRRDGWKSLGQGDGREITVVESYVRGRVLLAGTRRVVGRYPNIAGFMSSIGFFVTSALGLLLCFYRFAAPFDARRPRSGASGVPVPPMVPKTLPGRPDRSSHSSTPTRYLNREPSPMYSGSSVSIFIARGVKVLIQLYSPPRTSLQSQLPTLNSYGALIRQLMLMSRLMRKIGLSLFSPMYRRHLAPTSEKHILLLFLLALLLAPRTLPIQIMLCDQLVSIPPFLQGSTAYESLGGRYRTRRMPGRESGSTGCDQVYSDLTSG
jgi:hypothetical protein